jgi:hypothetical protein
MALVYARRFDPEGPVKAPLSPEQSSYRFWASFVLFSLAFGLGSAWDRGWHASHEFEDFYSPPHLFIYTTLALAIATFVSLTLSPERRAWFGASLRIPVLDLDVPASLLLTLAGWRPSCSRACSTTSGTRALAGRDRLVDSALDAWLRHT